MIGCCLPGAGQKLQYPVALIPDSLLENADEVIREETLHFTVRSARAGKLMVRRAVTILNAESRANVEVLGYDRDTRIKKFSATIYDRYGRLVRETKKSEIQDMSAVSDFSIYEDDRRQVLEVNHREFPYTVVFEYEIDRGGVSAMFYPHWRIQRYGASVVAGRFTIELPETFDFYYQALNLELEPEVTTEKGNKQYTWSVSGLPARRAEPYCPPTSAVLPMVLTAPDQFEVEGYQGSMADWKAYSAFSARLYQGRDRLPEELAEEVRRLAGQAAGDREKVALLYRYLQENTRYVSVQLGIGGWQPFDAEYVHRNKYGDCKALSNFMMALLGEAGIEALPVLIYRGRLDYEVREDFTFPRFNHMLLYLPELESWLECTSNHYPPNYLGDSNAGRNALLVDQQEGRLIRTPALTARENVRSHDIRVALAADGSAAVTSSGQYRGAPHERLRYLQYEYSEEDRRQWFLRQSPLPSLQIEKLEIASAADRPESRLTYAVNVKKYASPAGRRLFAPLLAMVNPPGIPRAVERRTLPVVQRETYTQQDTVRLQLPSGYRIENVTAEATSLDTPYGNYRLDIEKQADHLICRRTLTVLPGEWPAEAYPAFRDFFKTVNELDQVTAVLVKRKS